MLVRALGLKDYRAAWDLQKRLVDQRAADRVGDTLLLVEHPPVYTRGVSSKTTLPWTLPYPLHEVERGGDVTYHGPGQLVGYPILRLADHGLGVREYLRTIEAVLIEAVASLGVEAGTVRGLTGVWARGKKIASIGVAVRQGVSYHGFALNVHCDLNPFSWIHPCNLEPESIGTLAGMLPEPPAMENAISSVGRSFLTWFGKTPAAPSVGAAARFTVL